jgi:predicted oxidoreductase
LLNPPATAPKEVKDAASVLAELAVKKNTTPSAVALAWLLRHPAGIVPIIGSTNPDHVVENCEANRVELSRNEWYALLREVSKIKRPTT